MKTPARSCRPARRMSPECLANLKASNAVKRQAREQAWQARVDAAQQQRHPVAEFEPAPRLTLLPGGLHWSAQQPVPAVGATVAVKEPGTKLCHFRQVKGYTHAAGFLGLVTEAAPQGKGSRRKQASPRAGVVFGSQLALAA